MTIALNKLDELARDYESYTDKYFLRTRDILDSEGVNPIVRYQVFARQDIVGLNGVDEAVNFVKGVAGDKVRIYALKDGENYSSGEPMMKLEGHVQDLVALETVYLGLLSGNLTGDFDMGGVREKAKAVFEAAQGKPVLYFGARHFHPFLDENLGKICQEEGFVGCSTDVGAKAWGGVGGGTTPHALFLAYAAHMDEFGIGGNATVEGARAFDRNVDSNVPRIILGCTFNKEVSDIVETAKVVPNLAGTRIDTCGENYTQECNVRLPELDVNPKYLRGKGVKIASVWGLRQGLDNSGLGHLSLAVSSGFNAEKTAAFVEADRKYQEFFGKPLFDVIGTGSLAKPIMTTSDIVAYYNRPSDKWKPMAKVGRGEVASNRLEEVLE